MPQSWSTVNDGPACGTSTQHAALKIVQGTLHNNVASDGQLYYMNGTNLPPLFEFDFIDTHLWIASKQVVCVTNRATQEKHLVKFATGPCIAQPWIQAPQPPQGHTRERERRAAGHVCILLFRKQFKDQATSVDSQEPHQFCSLVLKSAKAVLL